MPVKRQRLSDRINSKAQLHAVNKKHTTYKDTKTLRVKQWKKMVAEVKRKLMWLY